MKESQRAAETVEPAAEPTAGRPAAGGMVAFAQSLQRTAGNRAATRVLSRAVEMRAPGRGEASAFERRGEFLDRINAQTPGVLYGLDDGNLLTYQVLDQSSVVNFDTKMMQFIDDTNLAPMRLITNEGLIGGQRLLIDSFNLAYVDLDDMLACSDLSFQMNLIHFLEERLAIPDYARKIGTDIAGFNRAHHAGIVAETEHLRSVVGDPDIQFTFEEDQGNGRVVFGFRSRPGRYRIFHIFTRRTRRRAGRRRHRAQGGRAAPDQHRAVPRGAGGGGRVGGDRGAGRVRAPAGRDRAPRRRAVRARALAGALVEPGDEALERLLAVLRGLVEELVEEPVPEHEDLLVGADLAVEGAADLRVGEAIRVAVHEQQRDASAPSRARRTSRSPP